MKRKGGRAGGPAVLSGVPEAKPGPKGQISVFLALVFLLVSALIAVTLESSRAACLDYLTEQAAASAADSVFAGFDSDLLKDFGLLAVRGRRGNTLTWTAEAERYARAFLQPADGMVRLGDRVGLASLSVRAADSIFMTEDGGRIFADAVLDHMTSAGLGQMLHDLLERIGLFDEDGAASFSGTLQNFLGSDEFSLEDILGNYGDLKNKAEDLIQAAQEAAANGGNGSGGGEGGGTAAEKPDLSGAGFSELLQELKQIKDGGILAAVTGASSISSLTWSDPERPSLLAAEEKAQHAGTAQADFSFDETLLLGEFLMERMSCFVESKGGAYRYEAEYVITGKSSERAALAAVAGDLMLIRTGLNFAYLCTDSEKLAAAETLALTVMTALTVPQLASVFKWILVAAWAAAESVVDLRALFQGKRVVLWKSRSSWKLSALSLGGAGEEMSGFTVGLGYRDYLRLLFYLKSGPQTAYRMMDVIQAREQAYRADFRLREYMVAAAFSLTAVTTTMYLQFPAFRRLSGAGFGRQYTKTASCGY